MMKIPKLKSQIPITDITLLSRLEFGILIFVAPRFRVDPFYFWNFSRV